MNINKFDKYVYIPNGIKNIEDDEFKGITTLQSIFLPPSIEKIGERAFFGCTGLKDIVLPQGLKYIGRSAFYYCKSLNKISLPDSIEKISKEAFLDCSLTRVIFSKYTHYIEELAFAQNNLSIIELPKNIKKIGHGSFYRTKHLVAYDNIEDGIQYAVHNLRPGLLSNVIPWMGHRLTIKSATSDNIKFSVYIAGSYWITTRNKILSLYNGGDFNIEEYDNYFEHIRSIDERITVALLRLKYPYLLSDKNKDIYIKDLQSHKVKSVQKVIYDNDIDALFQCDYYNLIDNDNIDILLQSAYEREDNVYIRSFLLNKKNQLKIHDKVSLYL